MGEGVVERIGGMPRGERSSLRIQIQTRTQYALAFEFGWKVTERGGRRIFLILGLSLWIIMDH